MVWPSSTDERRGTPTRRDLGCRVAAGAGRTCGAAGPRADSCRCRVPPLGACGGRGSANRADVVVLDAELSAARPRDALAGAMLDATTHAIEAWVSTRRTVMSDWCAREAWRQLASSVPRLLNGPDDAEPWARRCWDRFSQAPPPEHSTLGAAHACARPVSRRYGVPHGTALALLLPEVVRWNSRVVADRYAELAAVRGEARRPETLVARLEDLVVRWRASRAARGGRRHRK